MATLNYAFKELSCKIVYYGCGLCGKTTNLIHIHKTVPQKFRGELVSLATEQDRTLFFDFLPLDLGEVKGFKTKFQLYTVPGQVYYNATRKLVLRGVDGLVFVADSQRDRFQENIDSLENLKQNLAEYGYRLATGPTDFEGIPWVIQYNKRDMPQVNSVEELQKSLNSSTCPYFEAVAVTGQGVKDTLKGISSLVIKKLNADTSTGVPSTPSKEEKKPATVAAAAPAAASNDDYEAMSDEELSDLDKESAKGQAAAPKGATAPPKSVAPAPAAAAASKPAPAPAPRPAAKPAAAPAPPPAAAAAPATPSLNVVQRSSALIRGLGLGSANLTLANYSSEEPNLYQLTGKVSFLAVFGSTWSRKLRYQGQQERMHNGVSGKFFRFVSEDQSGPPLEVLVKDDFDKSLFVNYIGKMGQVQIVPAGKPPLN